MGVTAVHVERMSCCCRRVMGVGPCRCRGGRRWSGHSIDIALQAGLTSAETRRLESSMSDHRARNDASRSRLEAVAAGVADGTHRADVGEWSPSTLLAHLAFWDRLTLRRWHAAIRDG